MPTMPKTLKSTVMTETMAKDTVNAIVNGGTPDMHALGPITDTTSLRAFGDAILGNQELMNQFMHAVNRIAEVYVTSKMYQNPIAFLKRGMLEVGEVIEELFVDIARGYKYEYDGDTSANPPEAGFMKRVEDNTQVAFHKLNYRTFYKRTVYNDEIRLAFLSWGAVADFIAKIVNSMYSAAAMDEQMVMTYVIALALINGNITTFTAASSASDDIVKAVKTISNKLPFMSKKYNESGVYNFTDKADQYVFQNAATEAELSVDVLAKAFNMDKVEFSGRQIMLDSFADIDQERLSVLIGPDFVTIPADTLKQLDAIPAVVVDKSWFMIFDSLNKFTEFYNPQMLYWNYFYHVQKIVSHSPFSNAVAILTSAPAVTAVSISPATASLPVGGTLKLTATVTGTGFPQKTVAWASSNENVSVSADGVVTVDTGATGTATITATSVVDTTKKGTATITVAS